MSTTLTNSVIEFSKQIGDYWAGTATGNGAAGGTTIVDTALKARNNDWIDADNALMYDRMTSGTCDGEERRITALDNASGTLTVLAHTAQIDSADTYEVHRLATASDKRIALIRACRGSFPYLFNSIKDITHVAGNWLKNGGVTAWASSSYPDSWLASGVTATKTTTAPYYKGTTACQLGTAAGFIYQTNTTNPDLQSLAGKTVTFTAQGYTSVASNLRLCVNDGTTSTYSDYHDGDSAWTDDDEPLTVTATISETPSSINFRAYNDTTTTSYVTDLRVMTDGHRVYIGEAGIVNNSPHRVSYEIGDYTNTWQPAHNWSVDKDGYLFLPGLSDCRLRIEGLGVLDFLASGVSSTAWTATIAIDQPQLDILIAQAAVYLCQERMLPQYTTDQNNQWSNAYQFWKQELDERKRKFGMKAPPVSTRWT